MAIFKSSGENDYFTSHNNAKRYATNGQEALDCLRDTPFDLVMLDLKLGGRIDGMRILQAVKWRWPDTVAIILTGNASLDSTLQAIRENVDGYLLKPVSPDELRQAILSFCTK